ncbi:hypothetical protein QTP86_032694, partial [Hemibagrus guttatus]
MDTSRAAKLEFAVQMSCESCVRAVKGALEKQPGVQSVQVDLTRGEVLVETSLSTREVQDLIESTGRRAVLKGIGGSEADLGAAVAMLSGAGQVQGVVRFLQLSEDRCLIDGTIDGLEPGAHGLHVHQLGDLTQDCMSVCIVCAASVEECCVAVGNVVGHENIVSASRMNSAIVVFLNDVDKVRKLTQNGIVVNNETILVSPLSSPAKKVMLSNVPPVISDGAIGKELSRYGRMVPPIKKIPLGCKSPLVKHLVSFRRMVFMVFKEGVGELNVVFKFTVEGFDYNIFVSSDTDIKCFKCGQTGHLARACPETQSDPGVSERPGRDAAGVVPPAAAVRPAAEGPGAASAPDLTESEPQAQPAAQKPTGATPAPEQPRSARPDRKKPWSTEKSSVGSGAVLEPPALTEAGTEVQGNRMETPDTTPVQGDGGDVDMGMTPFLKYQIKGKNKEEQINVVYSAEDIKEFLRNTKWQKNVALEEFFPDRKQFIHDVKFFRREGAFVDVEIFRLKKLITR